MNKLYILPIFMLFIINIVIGTTANYDVAVDNDDWTIHSSSGRIDGQTLIYAEENNLGGFTRDAYVDLDTSAIPAGDDIDSATFYYYIDSITTGKGAVFSWDVRMLSEDELSYSIVDSGTSTATGWFSFSLTSSELDEIDRSSDKKTRFHFRMNYPGAGKTTIRAIRSREYGAGDTYDAYLTVTHNTPSAGICGTDYDGSGDWYINENIICDNYNYANESINGNIYINGSFRLTMNGTKFNQSLETYFVQGINYNSVWEGVA